MSQPPLAGLALGCSGKSPLSLLSIALSTWNLAHFAYAVSCEEGWQFGSLSATLSDRWTGSFRVRSGRALTPRRAVTSANTRRLPPQRLHANTSNPEQGRPPCKRFGEVEIRGGCGYRLADAKPPCKESGKEEAFEWKGACYGPSPPSGRKPTSGPP